MGIPLALVALMLYGASQHVLIGLTPDTEFDVHLDGAFVVAADSDALGVVDFTLESCERPVCTVFVTPHVDSHTIITGACSMRRRTE